MGRSNRTSESPQNVVLNGIRNLEGRRIPELFEKELVLENAVEDFVPSRC